MSTRHETSSNDGEIFRRTAVKGKAININPGIMRGGIRL